MGSQGRRVATYHQRGSQSESGALIERAGKGGWERAYRAHGDLQDETGEGGGCLHPQDDPPPPGLTLGPPCGAELPLRALTAGRRRAPKCPA